MFSFLMVPFVNSKMIEQAIRPLRFSHGAKCAAFEEGTSRIEFAALKSHVGSGYRGYSDAFRTLTRFSICHFPSAAAAVTSATLFFISRDSTVPLITS